MTTDVKRVVEDVELDSSSTSAVKHFHPCVTRFLDLPDEILLVICRYMTPPYVLYSFYTPKTPDTRLHRLILDYYTKINLAAVQYHEYCYLAGLFRDSHYQLQPRSLTLNNEQVFCQTQRYFNYMPIETIRSVFVNLKCLTLIDCCPEDLEIIDRQNQYLRGLEHLHVTVRKIDKNADICDTETSDASIGRLLFAGRMCALHTVTIEQPDGLALYKSLVAHKGLHHVNLVLQTIDDLYILLDGLVPNVKTMTVEVRQARLLTSRRPKCTRSCPHLTEFTLLESRIGLVVDDVESILGYMPALLTLTLSIRDTPDPTFAHGRTIEVMLTQHVPNLRTFHYTMTHRIGDRTVIEPFEQWSMNVVFYENDNTSWVHVFSLPWPFGREDQRRLPAVKNGCNTSVTSDVKRAEYMDHVLITTQDELCELKTRFCRARRVTTCQSFDNALPRRVYQLILTSQALTALIKSIPQPHIRHLIVHRRLIDETEISTLARQFPNVRYLELLFPLYKSAFLRCFKTLFSRDDDTDKKPCFWPELIGFCTVVDDDQSDSILSDSDLHRWLIQNTDLKFRPRSFHADCSNSIFSIWL